MRPATNAAKSPSSTFPERLDRVRMHSFDRKLAKKHLAHAERTLDALFGAFRAVRAAAVAWAGRVFPPADRQRDTYLAGAVDRVDLERRIRNWERRPIPFQDGI